MKVASPSDGIMRFTIFCRHWQSYRRPCPAKSIKEGEK
jgi:hypothetical protein